MNLYILKGTPGCNECEYDEVPVAPWPDILRHAKRQPFASIEHRPFVERSRWTHHEAKRPYLVIRNERSKSGIPHELILHRCKTLDEAVARGKAYVASPAPSPDLPVTSKIRCRSIAARLRAIVADPAAALTRTDLDAIGDAVQALEGLS
jgi:hypothetical protein